MPTGHASSTRGPSTRWMVSWRATAGSTWAGRTCTARPAGWNSRLRERCSWPRPVRCWTASTRVWPRHGAWGVAEFAGRRPDARVAFPDPSAGLAGGSTDVAFIRLPSATHGLAITPLFTEPCVVGVSAAHPMSRRERVRVADLLDEPIAIGRTDDGVWRDFWTLAGHRPGKRARTVVETHSQSEEGEVVAAGMACSVTPAAARRYSPHPGVRFITIGDHPGIGRRRGSSLRWDEPARRLVRGLRGGGARPRDTDPPHDRGRARGRLTAPAHSAEGSGRRISRAEAWRPRHG